MIKAIWGALLRDIDPKHRAFNATSTTLKGQGLSNWQNHLQGEIYVTVRMYVYTYIAVYDTAAVFGTWDDNWSKVKISGPFSLRPMYDVCIVLVRGPLGLVQGRLATSFSGIHVGGYLGPLSRNPFAPASLCHN